MDLSNPMVDDEEKEYLNKLIEENLNELNPKIYTNL